MTWGLKRFLLGLIAGTLVISAWLWSTALDYEYMEQEQEWTVPDRFKPHETAVDEEPEYVYKDPPPQYGWIYPPEKVRKTVGKIKKKIKGKNK